MERLTIRNSDGTVSQPTTTSIEDLFYRLAAYEDTGLEPEEIITGKELAEIACGLELLKKYQELGNFDRLRELAEADKEGRCVVLPCKIGSTIKTKGILKWKGTVIEYTLNEGGLYLFIESDGHYFYVRSEEAENGGEI